MGRDGAGEAQGEGHSRLAGRQRGAGWASLMCVRQSDCLRVIEAVAGEESKRSQGVTASSWLTVDKEPHARSPCGEYPDPCPRGPPGGRFPSVAVWSIPWYPIVRYCGSFLNLYTRKQPSQKETWCEHHAFRAFPPHSSHPCSRVVTARSRHTACSSPGGRPPSHTRSVRGSLLRATVPGSLLRARSCVLVRSFVRSFFH